MKYAISKESQSGPNQQKQKWQINKSKDVDIQFSAHSAFSKNNYNKRLTGTCIVHLVYEYDFSLAALLLFTTYPRKFAFNDR
jgi:hypothetical protein